MTVSSTRLRAFAHVYEAESFSGAALILGNSVPSITQLIHALEKEYGVVLFVKSGRRLNPTPAADQLYPVAVELRETEARAEKVLTRARRNDAETLRVGIGNAYPGMALVKQFRHAMPSVRVIIENGNWDRIMDLFKADQIDLGILPAVPDDKALRRVVCLEQRVVAVVPETHALSGRPGIRLADLNNQPLVFRSAGSSTQLQIDSALRDAGLHLEPVVVTDSRDGVLEAVTNGLGIGFVWEHSFLRTKGVRRIMIDELQNKIPEHAFAAAGNNSTLVRAFLNICASMRSKSTPG